MLKSILTSLWLLLLVAAFIPVSHHAKRLAAARAILFEKPALADMNPRLVNILTLGHRGLYDDFLAIHALQYLMDQNLQNIDSKITADALMAAARQEPKIQSFYMLGCFTLALNLKHPEYCEALNLVGVKAVPESWRIPLTQGFVFYNNIIDYGAASRWYALAASRPGAPEYLASLARKLADKSLMSIEEEKKTLEMMFDIPGGSKIREILEKNAARKAEEK